MKAEVVLRARRPWFAMLIPAVLLGCASPLGTSQTPGNVALPDGDAAWQQLGSELPGRWTANIEGHSIVVEYRFTARDSVLVETWMPDTPAETITTYHRDADAVLLTHYCGQGNQPRLRLHAVDGSRHRFVRMDITDLAPEEASLLELSLEFDGATVRRVETYVGQAQREETTLVFTRDASR